MNERSAFFCRIFRNENCFETYYKHVSNYQWIFMIVYDFGWRSWSKWFRSCHFNFKHVRKKVDDFFCQKRSICVIFSNHFLKTCLVMSKSICVKYLLHQKRIFWQIMSRKYNLTDFLLFHIYALCVKYQC